MDCWLGICEVGTAMKAEAMSGRGEEWSMASGHLEPPGTAHSYLLLGLETARRLLKAKSSHGMH